MKKALLLILSVFVWSAHAYAQAPFYQGKTIRVIVGTPPGNLYDLWARLIAEHMGKHIPGNPAFIVQNMPGAGHVVAVNHLYTIAKPDGLTLIGSRQPVALSQSARRHAHEIQFDGLSSVGSARRLAAQAKCICAAIRPTKPSKMCAQPRSRPNAGHGGYRTRFLFSKALQEDRRREIYTSPDIPVGTDIDLPSKRARFSALSRSRRFWPRAVSHLGKKGFVHHLFQSGSKRDARLPQTPTIFEIMDQYKTPESGRRLATVLLGADDMGRPMFAPPGMAADRLKLLRDSFVKTMQDEQFRAEVKKRGYEFDPVGGEELEKLAKEVTAQPPEIIERLKKVLGN